MIRYIVLIVFVLIDAIDYFDRINHMNLINPGILNCSALQLGETNMYIVLSACCLVDSVDRVLDKYLYGLVRTS